MSRTKPLWVVLLPCAFFAARGALAQISIEGVRDKEVYADRARLRVLSASGYDVTARLAGEPVRTDIPVPLDAWVDVTSPQFYLLSVEAREQAGGATQRREVRFIVRASERKDSERGLPPWTPYPPIPSASAEFEGARLVFVAPARYPAGLAIPAAARVEDAAGERRGVNGEVALPELGGKAIKILRGIGAASLPALAPGAYDCTPRMGPLATSKRIEIEETTAWTDVSGTIASDAAWPEDARIRVTGDLTVPSGVTLTVGAGAVVALAGGADLRINGHLVVAGTLERPVAFVPESPTAPWGGFIFKGSSSRGEIAGALLTGACANPRWFDENPESGATHLPHQALLYMSQATVAVTDSFFFDSKGQAGHGESASFTFTRSLFQRFLTGGEYNGGSIRLDRSAVIEFPLAEAPFQDDDGDAFYLTGGTHSVTDCLIGWAHDDGLDSGSSSAGSTLTIRNCWFESCFHEGLAFSGGSSSNPRRPDIRDTVILNSGQGIEAGWDYPMVVAERVLSTANAVGARLGDNYGWDYYGRLEIADSLLLYNLRDVWTRAWDDWEKHLSQVSIRSSYLSAADPDFAGLPLWHPSARAALLEPFLPTPGTAVGVGCATYAARFELADLERGVPVRLSRFTTVPVSVRYEVATEGGSLGGGALVFEPGETLKILRPEVPGPGERALVKVSLSDPVNAEVTGIREVTFGGRERIALVPLGSTWRYWDKGAFPGAGWRDASFADASWPEGPAELGFGDGDEATVIAGGPSNARYSALYFRRKFAAPARAFDALELRLRRDDGAVVYLNGLEVARSNMPAGPVEHGTWASGAVSDEDAYVPFALDPAALVPGENLLAVEVHQANATSSDSSFDLELVALAEIVPAGPRFVRGDANGDDEVDISDAVSVLRVLFLGDASECLDALDADDDGGTSITDAIYILDYLFRGGRAIPPPHPEPGPDPTEDALGCSR
ncbi:MAG: hypothetical protein ACUVYA_06785 [Planctomycetota bacterium]